MYFRKGVAADVYGANGATWQTTVWLGTVSTSGTSNARLKDANLSGKRSWAKYVFLPKPNTTETIRFIAWICNVQLATRSGQETPSLAENPPVDRSVDIDIPGFGSILDNVDDAVESTFARVGSFEGYEVWRVDDETGGVHLLASDGSYLFQTMSSAADFAAMGVPMRIDTPSGSIQFALLPSAERLDTTQLRSAGFTDVGAGLFATAETADEYSVIELPPASGLRSASLVTVPLLIPPNP